MYVNPYIRSFKSNVTSLMPYILSSWHYKCRFDMD